MAHLLAKAELGEYIRRRRAECLLSGSQVARELGVDRQRLHNFERGYAITQDIGLWIRLADVLQLNRKHFLARVWRASRTGLSLELPDEGDPRRDLLLDLAIEQWSDDDVLNGGSGEK